MTQFKRFVAGKYADQDITDFISTHQIDRDHYQENGDVLFFYRDPSDVGTSAMTHIDTLDRAITLAQKDIFDAQLGLAEETGNLIDIAAAIKETQPNESKKWDALQTRRKMSEEQKTMHEKTIEGRNRQIDDLRVKHKELLKLLAKEVSTKPKRK